MADGVDEIRLRASAMGGSERIYLLQRGDHADPDTYNVIGGVAPGVDRSRWPMVSGEPMTHLFTLDTTTMPELTRGIGDIRAVSVFCLHPEDNEAYSPGNTDTALVLSTDTQLAAAGDPPATPELGRAYFEPVAVDVDPGVWRDDENDPAPSTEITELRDLIFGAHARVLGKPIWLQFDEDSGTFLMQFDDNFCPMNLGDSGVMYVFRSTAFWQCY